VFHLKVIEEADNKTSLCGMTASGQHVGFFIIIDPLAPQHLVVNIKSDDEALADSLLEELGNLQY